MAPRRYTVHDVNDSLTAWLRLTDDAQRRLRVLKWIDHLAEGGLSAVSTYSWERAKGRGHRLHAGDVPGTRCAVVFSILDVPVRTVLLIDIIDLDD